MREAIFKTFFRKIPSAVILSEATQKCCEAETRSASALRSDLAAPEANLCSFLKIDFCAYAEKPHLD